MSVGKMKSMSVKEQDYKEQCFPVTLGLASMVDYIIDFKQIR